MADISVSQILSKLRFTSARGKQRFLQRLDENSRELRFENFKLSKEPRVVLDLNVARDTNKVAIHCQALGADPLIEEACNGLFFIPNDFDSSKVHMGFKALSKWMTFFRYDAPHMQLPINQDIKVMKEFNTWLLAEENGGLSQFEKGKNFFTRYFEEGSKGMLFKSLFEIKLKIVKGDQVAIVDIGLKMAEIRLLYQEDIRPTEAIEKLENQVRAIKDLIKSAKAF